eukprot:1146656-Pelagomonas_calceolata.AAC.7
MRRMLFHAIHLTSLEQDSSAPTQHTEPHRAQSRHTAYSAHTQLTALSAPPCSTQCLTQQTVPILHSTGLSHGTQCPHALHVVPILHSSAHIQHGTLSAPPPSTQSLKQHSAI